MGIYDRDYGRSDYDGGRQIRFSLPAMTPAVKIILIINIAVFIPCFVVQPVQDAIYGMFSVFPANTIMSLQVWRLITYQFLHSGIFHIFFNMLVLYFFGPMLERSWGSKKFVIFYLFCGACGGILYTVLVLLKLMAAIILVGASGAILGMLAAGAVLYPNMRVFVLGIFPMSMRTLVILIAIMSLLGAMAGPNPGGDVAHLAGLAAGAVYLLWPRWRAKIGTDSARDTTKWESKINQQRVFQSQVDRILDKVHNNGIASLTRKEKKMLREATKREHHYG